MALSMKAAGSVAQVRQAAIPTAVPPPRVSAASTPTRRIAHSVPAQSVPSVRAQPGSQPRTARKHVVPAAAAVEAPPLPSLQQGVTNDKPTVIITGASSGLGLNAAKNMAASGKWHVVMACRDFAKAEREARKIGIPKGSYTVMHLDLAALDSVRIFADMYKASGRRLDALVCNAAVYLPTAKEPVYSADGFELSIATNHLGHFLLVQLLMDKLKEAPNKDPRCIIVGSITGNTNTLAGNVPPKANLGDLSGLENMQPMADGGEFDGAKAYKDAKVCNMLTMRQLHKRLHEQSGITFASLYPGCIATSGLFRNHVPLFRYLFPRFQKNITKGYVSEEEAGRRLMEVVSNPDLKKSGVYWSWSNTSGSFENQLSEEASDDEKGSRLWDVSMKLVGLA